MQLCLKVNKEQRELCNKKCVGVRKIYNDGSFRPQWSVGESSQQDIRPVILGASLGTAAPGLRTGPVSVCHERSTKK